MDLILEEGEIDAGQWSICERCRDCLISAAPEQVLKCCQCESSFHVRCVEPPIFVVKDPIDWHCPRCSRSTNDDKRQSGHLSSPEKERSTSNAVREVMVSSGSLLAKENNELETVQEDHGLFELMNQPDIDEDMDEYINNIVNGQSSDSSSTNVDGSMTEGEAFDQLEPTGKNENGPSTPRRVMPTSSATMVISPTNAPASSISTSKVESITMPPPPAFVPTAGLCYLYEEAVLDTPVKLPPIAIRPRIPPCSEIATSVSEAVDNLWEKPVLAQFFGAHDESSLKLFLSKSAIASTVEPTFALQEHGASSILGSLGLNGDASLVMHLTLSFDEGTNAWAITNSTTEDKFGSDDSGKRIPLQLVLLVKRALAGAAVTEQILALSSSSSSTRDLHKEIVASDNKEPDGASESEQRPTTTSEEQCMVASEQGKVEEANTSTGDEIIRESQLEGDGDAKVECNGDEASSNSSSSSLSSVTPPCEPVSATDTVAPNDQACESGRPVETAVIPALVEVVSDNNVFQELAPTTIPVQSQCVAEAAEVVQPIITVSTESSTEPPADNAGLMEKIESKEGSHEEILSRRDEITAFLEANVVPPTASESSSVTLKNQEDSSFRNQPSSGPLTVGPKKVKTSKFKGVSFRTRGQKWVAHIYVNSKQFYLGSFNLEQEAAVAYDKAREQVALGTFSNNSASNSTVAMAMANLSTVTSPSVNHEAVGRLSVCNLPLKVAAMGGDNVIVSSVSEEKAVPEDPSAVSGLSISCERMVADEAPSITIQLPLAAPQIVLPALAERSFETKLREDDVIKGSNPRDEETATVSITGNESIILAAVTPGEDQEIVFPWAEKHQSDGEEQAPKPVETVVKMEPTSESDLGLDNAMMAATDSNENPDDDDDDDEDEAEANAYAPATATSNNSNASVSLTLPPAKRRKTRAKRCGKCPGCQVKDLCGVCPGCKHKVKFGGTGRTQRGCFARKCDNLIRQDGSLVPPSVRRQSSAVMVRTPRDPSESSSPRKRTKTTTGVHSTPSLSKQKMNVVASVSNNSSSNAPSVVKQKIAVSNIRMDLYLPRWWWKSSEVTAEAKSTLATFVNAVERKMAIFTHESNFKGIRRYPFRFSTTRDAFDFEPVQVIVDQEVLESSAEGAVRHQRRIDWCVSKSDASEEMLKTNKLVPHESNPEMLKLGCSTFVSVLDDSTLTKVEKEAMEVFETSIRDEQLRPETFHHSYVPRAHQRAKTEPLSSLVTRTKMFFGARYMWTGNQLADTSAKRARGIRIDVKRPPQFATDIVLPKVFDSGALPRDAIVNQVAMNIYHTGTTGIAPHYDDSQRFELPVVSVRIFSDCRLAFGCRGSWGIGNGEFEIPMPRGSTMVLREGSYASDCVKHCIRPSDLNGRSGVILFRKIHENLLVEALEVELDDITSRFGRTELGFNVNSSVNSCMESLLNQVEVLATQGNDKIVGGEQEYQIPLPGSQEVKEGEDGNLMEDDSASECDDMEVEVANIGERDSARALEIPRNDGDDVVQAAGVSPGEILLSKEDPSSESDLEDEEDEDTELKEPDTTEQLEQQEPENSSNILQGESLRSLEENDSVQPTSNY